ncbi:MAG: hypothetical protein HC877_09485 [Thioploca sp.]|nr:hypothetical protein [Thioploca sp.]
MLLLPLCIWTNFVKAATNCSQVTEIPKIECEALIALYNSTNGPGWKNKAGWNTNNTPCSWYGISCVDGYVYSIRLIGNYLSGLIPPELGNLSNLQWLWLYYNKLSGPIPPELGNLDNLRSLELNNNQLSGPIPPELSNLDNLQSLSLNYNPLSGTIPSELSNLSNLQGLYLYSNQLSGPIPPELGNLSNLQWLLLYDNKLSGPIPPELGNLDNLRSLELSNNQLSGPIPPELSNLSKLQHLWLSENQLIGLIPSELSNLSNLQQLWLHKNQLCGNIPLSLMNLNNLSYSGLVLRNNALNIDNLDPALGAFLYSHGVILEPQNPAPAVCPALLATLAYFEAMPVSTGIRLNWQTLVEADNAGFVIWRGQPTGSQCSSYPADYHEIVQIGFEISQGNGFSGTTYFHQDNTVEPETTYCYLLEDIDFEANGTFHWDSIASVTTP